MPNRVVSILSSLLILISLDRDAISVLTIAIRTFYSGTQATKLLPIAV